MEHNNVANYKEKLNLLYEQASKLEGSNKEEAISILKQANSIALDNIETANYVLLSKLPNLLKRLNRIQESEIERRKIVEAYKTYKQNKIKQQWDLLVSKYQDNFEVEIKSGTIDHSCSYHSNVFKTNLKGTADTFNRYISKINESEDCKCWFIVLNHNLSQKKIEYSADIKPKSFTYVERKPVEIQKNNNFNVQSSSVSKAVINDINKQSLDIKNSLETNINLSEKIEQVLNKAKENIKLVKAKESTANIEKNNINIVNTYENIKTEANTKVSNIKSFNTTYNTSAVLKQEVSSFVKNNIEEAKNEEKVDVNTLSSLNLTPNVKTLSNNLYDNLIVNDSVISATDLTENIIVVKTETTEIQQSNNNSLTNEPIVQNVSLHANILANNNQEIVNLTITEEIVNVVETTESTTIENEIKSFNNLVQFLQNNLPQASSSAIKNTEVVEDVVVNNANLPKIEIIESKIALPEVPTVYTIEDTEENERVGLVPIPDVIIDDSDVLNLIKHNMISNTFIIDNTTIKQNNFETIESNIITSDFNNYVYENNTKIIKKDSISKNTFTVFLWWVFLLLLVCIGLVVQFKFF